MKVVAANGHLGTGFKEASLAAAVEGASFVGCDAGSTDPGPFYLGSGRMQASAEAVRRDLALILESALPRGLPVLIGSAGTAGARPHLDRLVAMVRELASERGWRFKLATIASDLDGDALAGAYEAGRVLPLDPAPAIDADALRAGLRYVGVMGAEPFRRALDAGADVVIAGRASDAAIFAALPLAAGVPEAVAWHAGKVLECGAACAEQRLYPDSMCATLDATGFVIEAPNPALRCTPASVAAHSFYEISDPGRILEPSGVLDTTGCTYVALDDRRVRVENSRFTETDQYTIRVEGVRLAGYRSVVVAGIRDPLVIGRISAFVDEVAEVVRTKARDSLGLAPAEYSCRWQIYGVDGSLGALEPERSHAGHEVGLVIDAVGRTQEAASGIASIAWHTALHHPIPEYSGLISSLAFPFSPPALDAGPVYEFCVNHVLRVDDPCEPFPMTIEEL